MTTSPPPAAAGPPDVGTAPGPGPAGLTPPVLGEGRGLPPKYARLKENVLRLIDSLPAGAPIHTERQLCDLYGVSRTTVQKALQELVHEGHLYRLQGKGTFVAQPKLVQTIQLHGHTEEMEAQGLRPGSHLLATGNVSAPPDVASFFAIEPEAQLHRIARVRLVNDEPIALQTVFLDASRFGDVGRWLATAVSLYQLLHDRYHVQIAGGDETIEAGPAADEDAAQLRVLPGAPLLILRRRSWEADGTPVEWSESLYRGDRYRVAVQLTAG